MIKCTALLALFCVFGIESTLGGEVSYHGHQVWRVVPPSKDILTVLRNTGEAFELDFWNEPVSIGWPVDFMIPADKLDDVRKRLLTRGISDIQVNIPDVQALIDSQRAEREKVEERKTGRASIESVADFDYSKYHVAAEVYAWIDMVVKEFPNLATKTQIGTTYEGRPIYALEFKKNSTSPRPIIFVDSLIHCREWITTASLLYIFKEMLQNQDYAHMMEDVDWYFIPMINVDGYVETHTGDRLWRKTKSTGASRQCVGVDGNRNWDAHWSYPGASPLPCSLIFYGPTAFSESETRHIANYVLGFGTGKIDAYVSTHSASQLILYPYGYTFERAVDDAVLNYTGKLMSDAIRSVHGKNYVHGPTASTIYPASGSTTDWTYDVAKSILSYTYELRDTGEYGHLLPPDQIIPNGQEYLAGIEALKNYVLENFN